MPEAWNIKTDDNRIEDTLPVFIIFCEDKVSEPVYFKYFETPLIKVNPIGNQKSKIDNVLRAITHCVSEGIMQQTEGGAVVLNSDDIQVWCVFDRDKEGTPEEPLGNTKFNEAIRTAKNGGLKVAWSNDGFELWVLLHFEDIDPTSAAYKTRVAYYDRLTEILQTMPNPNEDLIKALGHASFSYKKDMKSENNFRSIIRDEIVGKTDDAIKRAKALVEHHAKSNQPPHEKAPCTMVHLLVEELIRLGGKAI